MAETGKQVVLIVEDEAPAAEALQITLENEGFAVHVENDGEAGLKKALEVHPDIILADLKMPKKGGLEMIKELRADSWGKTARIVILTNISDLSVVEDAMAEGAFSFLFKGDTPLAKVVEKVREELAKPAPLA